MTPDEVELFRLRYLIDSGRYMAVGSYSNIMNTLYLYPAPNSAKWSRKFNHYVPFIHHGVQVEWILN